MKNKSKDMVRVKHVRYKNMDDLTFYEKWRLILAVIHIVAMLGAPFVAVFFNEYLKARG